MYSNDSNHSSQFTVLVVVAFTKKGNKANTQPSTEYCRVRTRINEINNIMRIVKYEYDEYFKL